MKKIWVKWRDHATCDYGWTRADQIDSPDLPCETCGFLVREDKNFLVVANSKYSDSETVCMTMSIVKKAIIERKYLE